MRTYIYLLTAIFLSACASVSRTDVSKETDLESGELRFDGMYYKDGVITQNRSYGNNYTYLRFYPDGTVIRAATASNPDEVAKWLNKSRSSQTSNYKLKKGNISFAINANGDISTYDGEILENKIRMTVYSGGNTYIEDYYFMQIDLPSN